MATVARVSVAPLKGAALSHPDTVALTATGATGDRVLHCVDERGRLVNGKQCAALTSVSAEIDGDRLTLALPDGTTVEGPLPTGGQRVATSFYGRRQVPGTVIDGPLSDALSDLAGRRLRLVRPDPGAIAVDVAPISLVSTATLEALAAVADAPRQRWADRFRTTLEIAGLPERAEEAWSGREIAVGAARLRVGEPIPRCAVTQLDPATGERDVDTLAALRAWRGTSETVTLAMWAEVAHPGTVAVGDPVAPLA